MGVWNTMVEVWQRTDKKALTIGAIGGDVIGEVFGPGRKIIKAGGDLIHNVSKGKNNNSNNAVAQAEENIANG